MFTVEFLDSDGDLCMMEFHSKKELEEFLDSYKEGKILVISKGPISELEQDIQLQLMFFPPNKVN